jgi:pimeloyl-ACP methyl ester carboxylesterase
MQSELLMLSTDCQKKSAQKSGHFVWVDQPEMIAQAVKELLDKVN